jgi:hypothetical protein
MVVNTTLSNISAILWRSVLLVEDTTVLETTTMCARYFLLFVSE